MSVSAAVPAYATTIAGALLPVMVAALGTLIKLYFRRLEKQWKLGHEQTVKGQDEITKRLNEAEALIRGDLKNGIKSDLNQIKSEVAKVNERQGQTAQQNLKADDKG